MNVNHQTPAAQPPSEDNNPFDRFPLDSVVDAGEQLPNPDSELALTDASRFLDDIRSPHDALRKITARLGELGIPYAVVGGTAPVHGYRRLTEVVELLVTREGLKLIHEKLVGCGYHRPSPRGKNLRDAELGVKIAFMVSGEFPGDARPKPVAFPDPIAASYEAHGVRYLNLSTLIELKLASGMTSGGRLKDLSDVLELIKTLDIPLDYASTLNPYVQAKFKELWQTSRRQYVCLWRARNLTAQAKSLDEMIQRLGAEVDRLRAMKQDGVVLDPEGGVGEDIARLITVDPKTAKRYGMEDETEFWDNNRTEEYDAVGVTIEEPGPALRFTRRFDGPPERVFDAWLDPGTANRWPFTTLASDRSSTRIEARVAGTWSITQTRDGNDFTAVGEYLEIDRPRKLVISFGMFSSRFGRVMIELAPAGAGSILSLTHECLSIEDHGETEKAWTKMLDALEASLALSAGFAVVTEPGSVRFERVLPGPIECVWAYLTQSDLRGKWLASGAMEQQVGSAFELRFHHASLSTNVVPTPQQFKGYERGYVSQHRLLRLEPRMALAFTWGRGADAPSEASFELTPQGDDVRLVLTHRRLANLEAMTDVAYGWHAHLALLVDRLNGREPPSFWSVFGANDGEYERRFAAINGKGHATKLLAGT